MSSTVSKTHRPHRSTNSLPLIAHRQTKMWLVLFTRGMLVSQQSGGTIIFHDYSSDALNAEQFLVFLCRAVQRGEDVLSVMGIAQQ